MCQGWGLLLLVCMHRGGTAPQGVHLVPYMSLPCPHYVGVPLRCPLLAASSFSADHVVSIPGSQWLHNSCHADLRARFLLAFWDPSGLADHHAWTLPFSCAPSGPVWHHAWMLLVCHGRSGHAWTLVFSHDSLLILTATHAPHQPPVVSLVLQTTMHEPQCSPLVPLVLQTTVHGPCRPSCGLSSPTTQPIWIPSVPGAPPASRVRPAVYDPGLCHPSQSHLKQPRAGNSGEQLALLGKS